MTIRESVGRMLSALGSSLVRNASGNLVSSSDPRVVELLGGIPSAAGVYVNAETAMRVAAVYACVNRIAGGIATLPCNVYERTWDSGRRKYITREVEDASLWWLLNEQPSAAWSGALHWERVTEHRLLRGAHYTEIRRKPDGTVGELVPLPWSAVMVEPMSLEVGSRLFYAVNDGLRVRGVDQDDMLHFPGFGYDGVHGRSVIGWAARQATGNAIVMDEFAGNFFANAATPSMVLEAAKGLTSDAIAQLRSEFENRYAGTRQAHKPLVLANGVTAKAISVTAEDAQLLDSRKFSVIEIARAFGVPPHLIGETSASTSWGSGLEALGRGFVTYTLQQHLVVMEQELNRKLYRTAKRFVQFDRSALLEGDKAAQGNYYRAALGGPGTGKGWMSVNEVRNEENRPPLEGEDGIFNPNDTPTAPKPNEGKA